MINRITHDNAAAVAPRSITAPRSTQTASTADAEQPGAQYNFAELFGGNNWGATEATAKPSSVSTAPSHGGIDTAIATATATITSKVSAGTRSTPTDTAATTTAATTSSTATATTPGIQALVTAIMNGSFNPTNVTDPSQLKETTPAGTDTMPNFYYASDQTAAQLAQLLGGTVVKMPAFGQEKGYSEPNANFIQLSNGQTFNAADVAYYARTGSEGTAQLTADITATINEGSAWTKYYQQGGDMPSFASGYVGPAITGMTYPSGTVAANGNVINPAMPQSNT